MPVPLTCARYGTENCPPPALLLSPIAPRNVTGFGLYEDLLDKVIMYPEVEPVVPLLTNDSISLPVEVVLTPSIIQADELTGALTRSLYPVAVVPMLASSE